MSADCPVSPAAFARLATFSLTTLVLWATVVTLCAISRVVASCCSTAEATAVEISLTLDIVAPMRSIAATASRVVVWIARIWLEISSVAVAVCEASAFTSPATTANPLPASPARAASIVALSASRLVCAATAWINLSTSPIFCAAFARACMVARVLSASCTAAPATVADSPTLRPISLIEALSSSAAAAIECTPREACAEAEAAEPASVFALEATSAIALAVSCICAAEPVTVSATVLTSLSRRLASVRSSLRRSSLMRLRSSDACSARRRASRRASRRTLSADAISAISSVPWGGDLRVEVAIGDAGHAAPEPGYAANHAAADVEPAEREGRHQTDQRQGDENNLAAPDLADRGVRGLCRGRLAAPAQGRNLPLELSRKRAVLLDHLLARDRAAEFLVFELENVAVAAPDAYEVGHELGYRPIPEGDGRPVEMARRCDEAVLDGRHLLPVAQIGGLDEDSEKEISFGAQLQYRLQRDEIVIGKRAQPAADVGEVALVGGLLNRQRKRESYIVHHRHEFLGKLLVRGAHRADEGRPLGRDRPAFRHRLGQAIDIFGHAPGGFLELRGVLAVKRGHRVVERHTSGIERLERASTLVRAGGGEQGLRLADYVRRRHGDIGGPRHVGQARAGDDLERAPEMIIRHERGRAREHRDGRDRAEGREQPAPQAEPVP